MSDYVTAGTIHALREKKGLTQKQLAEQLSVSDKTVSKWETGHGLPDISLIVPLAGALGVSVAELLAGAWASNRNRSANLRRSCFYVCPVCGNVIHAMGEGAFSCCGISLPVLEAEEPDAAHAISVERVEDEYYVRLAHPMEREHFITFLAYVSDDGLQMKKLYPEQGAETRFYPAGGGWLYACCNRHGLFRVKI